MAVKKKTREKDGRIAWPERQTMLSTRIIHIYRVFLYTTFQRMLLYGQNRRVSDIEEILLFKVVGLMLRTGFEDTCYELVPLVKSGEDNQRIQLIKGLIPHRTRLLNILFG